MIIKRLVDGSEQFLGGRAERITKADIALFREHLKEEARYRAERGASARRAEIKASASPLSELAER